MKRIFVTFLCCFVAKKRWRLALRRLILQSELLNEIHRKFYTSLGYSLDLTAPQTYNAKIQWYKLFYRNELFVLCADKYRVREYFVQKKLSQYQVQLYGVWDSYNEIDWDLLPNQCVIKTNHAAGQVWIIRDKQSFNKRKFKKSVTEAIECKFGEKDAQFHYSQIEPKIIAEEYLEDDAGSLNDYKIYCFHGKAHYIQVDFDRFSSHSYAIYDRNWNDTGCRDGKKTVERPKKLNRMLEIAETLSEDFPHVRIDLFYVNNRIYLGEMTFTTGSGFDSFTPDKWDKIFGDCWDISRIAPSFIRTKPCLRSCDYMKP